jgi:hypothetical protein
MKIIQTTLLFIALASLYFFSSSVIAEDSTNTVEGFSYDYIDINSYDLDFNSADAYEGYSVFISKSLSKNLHLLGRFTDSKDAGIGNTGDTLDSSRIGFGVNYPINSSTDFVVDYLYDKYYYTYVARLDAKGKANIISSKIRHQFTDDIELNAGLQRIDIVANPILFKGYSVGGLYRISDNISLNVEITSLKDSSPTTVDVDTKEFGIRYYF